MIFIKKRFVCNLHVQILKCKPKCVQEEHSGNVKSYHILMHLSDVPKLTK